MKKINILVGILCAALFAATFASCADHRVSNISNTTLTLEKFNEAGSIGDITVYTEKKIDKDRRDKILRSCEYITKAAEKDFGKRVGRIKIYVLDAGAFTDPTQDGPLNGLFYAPFGPIVVVAGPSDNLPALYHEYCHLFAPQNDLEHKMPDWAKWNERQKQVQAEMF